MCRDTHTECITAPVIHRPALPSARRVFRLCFVPKQAMSQGTCLLSCGENKPHSLNIITLVQPCNRRGWTEYTGCPRRNVPDFRRVFLMLKYTDITQTYVKVYRYNPKHLCPKLNGYGDNGQRKVWSSGRSMHCTCQLTTLSMHVLECGFILRQFSSCSQ